MGVWTWAELRKVQKRDSRAHSHAHWPRPLRQGMQTAGVRFYVTCSSACSCLLFAAGVAAVKSHGAQSRTCIPAMLYLLRPFAVLWQPYEPAYYWLEPLECARRVLLTGGLTFVGPSAYASSGVEPLRAACGFAVSLLSFVCYREVRLRV